MLASPNASLSLAGHLHRTTEALTVTHDLQTVCRVMFESAQAALGAVAGAVFLASGSSSELTATWSSSEDFPPTWQNDPLDDTGLPGRALRLRLPQYVDGEERAAPTRAGTGEAPPRVSAALPLVVEHRVLGVLALDFAAARMLGPEERHFLGTLAGQGGLAIDRAQVMGRLQRSAENLSAFLAFTEAVGASTDVRQLAEQAQQVLRTSIPDLRGVYFELIGDRWVPRLDTGDLPDSVRDELVHGYSRDVPGFAQAVAERRTVFLDHWDAQAQGLPLTGAFQAAAVTPYFRQDQAFGLFAAGIGGRGGWTAEQREFYQAVAGSLGGALHRAQQMQVQERQAALDAFVLLTEAIGTERDPQRLAERARDLILAFLPGWSVGYYDLEGALWKARLAHVPTPEMEARLRAGLPMDAPGFAEAVDAGGPVFLTRWDAGRPLFEHTEDSGLAAFYPYFSEGQASAMFVVGSDHARVWADADRSVLLAVGRSLGLALDSARQAERLRQQNEALEAFTRLTETSADTTDVGTLVDRATDVLRATLSDVSIAYYDLRDGRWEARAWSGDIPAVHLAQMQRGFAADVPRFVHAVQARQPLFVSDWHPEREGLPTSAGYGAVASYPYFTGGRPVGLLSVGLKHRTAWTPREQAIVRAVGRSLGLALERAAHIRQLQMQRDILDARTAALSAANEELEAFTYSASHDLRTPIRHVMGFADLARSALVKNDPDKVMRHLGIVQQGAARMENLIDGMLRLSRAGRDGFRPMLVDLSPLITQAQQEAELEFPDHPVRWTVPDAVVVWGDQVLLQNVITNLLSNAVKFSSTRGLSEVRVEVAGGPAEWNISVHDNGVGFDVRYADKLFGMFQRMHAQEVFQGTGVGLATVRRIVLKHGGRVYARGEDGVGATFGFTLPRPLEG